LQVIYYSSDENENLLNTILKKHCKKLKLVNLKTVSYDNELEAFYHVLLKKKKKSEKLINDLNAIKEIKNVNIYFDEDESKLPY